MLPSPISAWKTFHLSAQVSSNLESHFQHPGEGDAFSSKLWRTVHSYKWAAQRQNSRVQTLASVPGHVFTFVPPLAPSRVLEHSRCSVNGWVKLVSSRLCWVLMLLFDIIFWKHTLFIIIIGPVRSIFRYVRVDYFKLSCSLLFKT